MAEGEAMPHGADSEVGHLRSVLLHRPGPELRRLTPRNNDRLLFDGIPWVGRAQDEHDAFATALRDRGVEVLYVTELLTAVLREGPARADAVEGVLADLRLGATMRGWLRRYLHELDGEALAGVLVAGLRNDEVGRGEGHAGGLVSALLAPEDFVVDPLPNLLFTRDSSVWVRDRVAVTSLAMPARRRETQLLELIYTHHPRFAGVEHVYSSDREHVEGGDVLLLAPGVIAVGTGERTTPAGVERLADAVLRRGLAHTVLAVPIAQDRATMHLDTVCTMVDTDAVVMYPNISRELTAVPVRLADGEGPEGGRLEVGERRPFLQVAAEAMGIEALRLIDTGLDPVTAEREQWDDGNNTLALAPGLVVAYERNIETNARLEEYGVQVVAISGSELGSGRGGPRCMSCPVSRDSLSAG